MSTEAMQVIPHEREVIETMRALGDREWRDAGLMYAGKSVYVSLIEARAELYLLALGGDDYDLLEKYSRFAKLLSAHEVLDLCSAWHQLQARILEDDEGDYIEPEN